MDEIKFPEHPYLAEKDGKWELNEEGEKLLKQLRALSFVEQAYIRHSSVELVIKRPVIENCAKPGEEEMTQEEYEGFFQDSEIKEEHRGLYLFPRGEKTFHMLLDARYFIKDHPLNQAVQILLADPDRWDEDGQIYGGYRLLTEIGALGFGGKIPYDSRDGRVYLSPHFFLSRDTGPLGLKIDRVCSHETAPLDMIRVGSLLGFVFSFYHVLSKYHVTDNLGLPDHDKSFPYYGVKAYYSKAEGTFMEHMIDGMASLKPEEIGRESENYLQKLHRLEKEAQAKARMEAHRLKFANAPVATTTTTNFVTQTWDIQLTNATFTIVEEE